MVYILIIYLFSIDGIHSQYEIIETNSIKGCDKYAERQTEALIDSGYFIAADAFCIDTDMYNI